jgi:ankyrin repeat protein
MPGSDSWTSVLPLTPKRALMPLLVSLALLSLPVRSFPLPASDLDDFMDAARRGDAEVLASLIASGLDVNAADVDRTSALHWAVRSDALDAVELLLDAGADVAAENRHGITPIYLAAQNGNAPMIRTLLAAGGDANQVDRTGETVLMIAVQAGDADAVEVLLDHGARVDATDPTYGQTALMWAARDGYADVAAVLIDHGADPTARTRLGEAPEPRLPCVNRTGCGSHGVGIIRGGLPERGKRDPIPGEMTPLMYAAREGRLDVARLLLEAGADVNAVDVNGIGPLLLAISNNHIEVARFLLDAGADFRTVDWYGRTPLWAAVEMRNVDLHYTTFEHMVTPADREEILEFTRELLELGADPNIRIREVPPLRRWLYLLGGSLAWVDFTGQTPFLLASLSGDVTVMRLLLEYGADPHIPTFEDTTPLMAAAGVNWVVNQTYTEWDSLLEAVELCWELGMDVNAVNSMGLTAVMGAANRGSNDIIEFLVQKGARLDVTDDEGRTPLDWAGGVFLATHAPEPKPESMALIRELMGAAPAAPE